MKKSRFMLVGAMAAMGMALSSCGNSDNGQQCAKGHPKFGPKEEICDSCWHERRK